MHVAFATDAHYLPWCAVAVRSCVDHGGEGLVVHLLHDGTLGAEAGVEHLRAMVESSGAALVVHAVDPAALPALPAVDRFGTVVWLRFLLPELLPGVDRVLYLDVDTLAVSALQPLLTTDLAGAPVGAVANVVQPQQRARLAALGLDDHRSYFNSGVLLFDLDRCRAEGATASLLGVAASRGEDLRWPDQDALNLVFSHRWHPLHPRWNAQYTLWDTPETAIEVLGAAAVEEARLAPAILHFEGPTLCKPWHALNAHPWRRAWLSTLQRTPWAGTPVEDRGPATAALRLLPESVRVRAYSRLLKWRDRRAVAS